MANESPKKEFKTKPSFEFIAKKIPTDSGCYLYYDKDDRLLYVGKAKQLRNRVKSYFQKTKKSPKTELMVSKITRIETRITNSEIESLILENNLIKEFRPRFNILLRDDKNFLYLRITKEDFPRLEITRRIVRDGSFYVGPKTSAKSFRKTIAFCQKVFKIRDCRLQMTVEIVDGQRSTVDSIGAANSSSLIRKIKILKNPENRKLPCMDFHIKKCSGPCSGEISMEDYQADVVAMKKFLRGDTAGVLKSLQKKMMGFAETQNFEAAGKIRDLIQSIEVSTQKQTVQLDTTFEADFIHFYRQKNTAYFVRVLFRGGKFLDQNEVTFSAPALATDEEILEKFMIQFYEKVDEIPKTIYVPMEGEDMDRVATFLGSVETSKEKSPQPLLSREISGIKINIPQKGDKKKILDMAYKNARNMAKKDEIETMSQAENFSKALPALAKALDMKEPPRRIECYDISHFSGDSPVASQVVFIDGKTKKSKYRRYHVKSLPDKKVDDFASMEEVLGRRFTVPENQNTKEKFYRNLPNLVVIDGGKGQLSSVMKVFSNREKLKIEIEKIVPINRKQKKSKNKINTEDRESALKKDKAGVESKKDIKEEAVEVETIIEAIEFIPEKQIISLAKREEQIFRPGNSDPIELDWNDPALKLLQRVRDEAHRFAIGFNRSLRSKNMTKSMLDEVPGIGSVTKKKLMKEFDSVSGIRNASDENLLKVINQKQLTSLRKFL